MNATKRNQFIQEIAEELAMRRRVWRRVPGQAAEFMDQDHQRRYNLLQDLSSMLSAMRDSDVQMFLARHEANETAINNQKSLF